MPLDEVGQRYAAGLFSQEVVRLGRDRASTFSRLMTDLRRRGLLGDGPPAGFALSEIVRVQTEHAAAVLRARVSTLRRAYEEAGQLNSDAISEIMAIFQAHFSTVLESAAAQALDIVRSRSGGPPPAGFAESTRAHVNRDLAHAHDELLMDLTLERDRLIIRERQASTVASSRRSPKLEAWRRAEISSHILLALAGIGILGLLAFVSPKTSLGIGLLWLALVCAAAAVLLNIQRHRWEKYPNLPARVSTDLICWLASITVMLTAVFVYWGYVSHGVVEQSQVSSEAPPTRVREQSSQGAQEERIAQDGPNVSQPGGSAAGGKQEEKGREPGSRTTPPSPSTPHRDDSIETLVRRVIAEQLRVKLDRVTPDARLWEDLGATPLDTTELTMGLETAFDIEIPSDDARRLLTVRDVVQYVKSNVRRSSPAAKTKTSGGVKAAETPNGPDAGTKSQSFFDSKDKMNWRKHLRVGMTADEVRSLFGEPDRIYTGGTMQIWDYGSGSITLDDGKIHGWREPN